MVGRVVAMASLVAGASATNASVSCSISSSTDVVIYHGDGPTEECKQWESDFYEWLGLKVATVSASQMQNTNCGGRMSDLGVKIVVFPGGNAYNTQLSVQRQGKANILKFIDNGGLYVGTCAGFFFAASSYWWQDGHQGGGEFNWPNMLGRFPEVEGSITDIWDDDVSPGYKLTGIDNGLKAIYWGGPTRGWKRTSSSGFPGTILAHYSDVPGELLAAVHVNDNEHGNLLLFSAHFEAEEGIGIRNTGLTSSMQLANWQYRAQQIQAAAQLDLAIPSELPGRSTDDRVIV